MPAKEDEGTRLPKHGPLNCKRCATCRCGQLTCDRRRRQMQRRRRTARESRNRRGQVRETSALAKLNESLLTRKTGRFFREHGQHTRENLVRDDPLRLIGLISDPYLHDTTFTCTVTEVQTAYGNCHPRSAALCISWPISGAARNPFQAKNLVRIRKRIISVNIKIVSAQPESVTTASALRSTKPQSYSSG